jgi:hypothetical protein
MQTRIKNIAPIIPYVSVLIGIYTLQNAWTAILLYHALALVAMHTCKSKSGHIQIPNKFPLLPYIVTIACAAGGLIFYLTFPYITPNANTIADKLQHFNITSFACLY